MRFHVYLICAFLLFFYNGYIFAQTNIVDHTGKLFSLAFEDRLSGKNVSTEDFKGKVVVINFWFTSCGPCSEEIVRIKALYKKYHPLGVEFIGISLDRNIKTLIDYCNDNGIVWPQYCEEGKKWDTSVAQEWQVKRTPAIFILDKNGIICSSNARRNLEELIQAVLTQQ